MNRHAYLIMAHHNFSQLYRLMRFLDSANTDIYLHVDKKATGFNEEKAARICRYSTVTQIHRRTLAWGSNNLTQCEIDLLKAALPGNYDYYHLISGDDIPLRPLQDIHTFFDENFGKEFVSINWKATDDPNSNIHNRIRQYHIFQNLDVGDSRAMHRFVGKLQIVLNNLQRKARVDRCQNLPFRLGKGSQWFSITHSLADYTVSYYDSTLKKFFAYSYGTDELLIQTVLLNEPSFLAQRYDKGNMRLIDWDRSPDGRSPYTFTIDDYDLLVSSEKLWARKVSESVDSEIVNLIYHTISIT